MNTVKPGELPDLQHPLLVLVADDIERSRTETACAVERLGHRTVRCSSGAQTLAAVATAQPDLVLLDLLMPDMDGYEVTRRLRLSNAHKWLPVIVTSALQGDHHFIEALTRGADDYLPRPVNPSLLQARLKHYQRVLTLSSQLSWVSTRERLVLEYIPDAVFTCDQQMRLCDANRAARALLSELGQTDAMGQRLPAVLRLNQASRPESVDLRIELLDGSARLYSVGCSEWMCNGERFTTIVLRDRSADLEFDRMKTEFLATVSHELRTPLTSIIGAIGILSGGAAGPLPAKAAALLQMAQRNGNRLSQLIDDVMDLTKLEGDRIQLDLRPVALAGLLHAALDAMTGYALKADVQLQLHLLAPEAVALADDSRLSQVVTNLLSNAVKHSPPGATVDLLLRGESAGWRIEVRDRGPGVPEKFRDHLFEKFSRADSSDERRNQGTGLGLYISRKLVRRMGGDIGLDLHHEGGAQFFVRLNAAELLPQPTLVVSRDLSQRERICAWVSGCGPVADVADLAGAQAWAKRHGTVAAVVADPAAQGEAGEFIAALSRLCPAESIVLAGDAADHAFARARGAVWVAPGPQARTELTKAVDKARQRSAARAKVVHA